MRRQLSIEDAALLEPHDHMAWYGDGEAGLYAMAGAALQAGARRREKLMFVADQPDPDRLSGVQELDRLLDTGQLELAAIADVYGDWSTFSASKQLRTFEDVLAAALADGYTGIRVVADNTALVREDEDGFRRWLAWERLTDDFQAKSAVTGICYFDRGALSVERQADLAALHPVRSRTSVEPPFTLFVDDGAVAVSGTLDVWSVDRFRRILGTSDDDRPLVLDLSETDFADHRALMALNAAASAERPVCVRGAPPTMRKLPAVLGMATPHLRFE
jgi:anti-anti-sigma regulatory factor